MVDSVFIKQDAATCPRDSFANVPTDGCKYVADIAKCAIDVCHWNVPPTKVRLFLLGPREKEESALLRDCLESRLTLLEANIVSGSSLIAELVKDDPPLARAAEGKSHTRSLPFPFRPYSQLSVPRFLQFSLPRGLTRPMLGSFKLFGLGFVFDLWGAEDTP